MDNKGAIICLQKYPTEYRNQPPHGDDGPVCLGYFNRIDVREIDTFRKYVREASRHEAKRACSRKQLLLHGRDNLHSDILIRNMSLSENKGKIPFRSSNPSEEYRLGCCSVFNIKDGGCRQNRTHGDCITRETLSRELYNQIKAIQHDGNFRFAILESLGAEDLCLIVLTNHYVHISNVVQAVQSFACPRSEKNTECSSCIIDNGHSVLMIDRSQKSESDMWGDTQASIHFSLRSIAGLHYLQTVERLLNTSGILRCGEQVTVVGCSGEYDAVMRCPARMLTEQLFCSEGYFAPGNLEYQCSVYQSETFVYPIGTNDAPDGPLLPTEPQKDTSSDELTEVVEAAVAELKELFHYSKDDPDFDYIELPLWRLLKDYWSFASFPLNKDLKADLKIQLIAAVSAIVAEAKKYTPEKKTDQFLESYDKIVDALRSSMQAGSQQDRWYFGEQKSYIQNVESYYKIMHGYYGIIKDLIHLIYHIERRNGEEQPLLIPLLSFGVKTIIKSDSFSCSIHGRPAKLICIRLPYQALANLPRYLGPLAHELFHYSAPAKRSVRNELMIKVLLRVAVTEFVSMLAKYQECEEIGDFSRQFFDGRKNFRGSFGFNELVDQIYENIGKRIHGKTDQIGDLKLHDIQDVILSQCLYFPLSRFDITANQFYFTLWRDIRNNLMQDMKLHPPIPDIWKSIFALNDEPEDEKLTKEEKLAKLYRHYVDVTKNILAKDIRKFRQLLYNTFKAMEECPADIFDLEVVMSGKNAAQKIQQYLWQINGARRDATLVRSVGEDNLDEWPPKDQKRILLSNHIRIAMILNYYLAVHNQGSLNDVLADWAPESGSYKVSLGKVKQGFIRDYQDVIKRFEGLLDENQTICHEIAERIRHLLADEHCNRIMKRLTTIYEQYYKLLELRQTGQNQSEKDDQKQLFDLCFNLIDAYQTQPPLDLDSNTSTQLEADTYPPDHNLEYLDCVACSSEDLSVCLSSAMNWLKVNHKIPHLWFRGDPRSNEHSSPDLVQPYEALHFGRMFHTEIVRATETWTDQAGSLPNCDAEIAVLNPILFNLAMELLEGAPNAAMNLKAYLEAEQLPQHRELLLDRTYAESCRYPRALIQEHLQGSCRVLVRGCAVDGDAHENPVRWLELLQLKYQEQYRMLQKLSGQDHFFWEQPFIPFLYRVKLNHLHHVDFVTYLRATGLRP